MCGEEEHEGPLGDPRLLIIFEGFAEVALLCRAIGVNSLRVFIVLRLPRGQKKVAIWGPKNRNWCLRVFLVLILAQRANEGPLGDPRLLGEAPLLKGGFAEEWGNG
jgi:hypothetical protein